MKKRIIFEEHDLVVTYKKYKDDRGEIFTITDGVNSFSPSELPEPLTYANLKRELDEYVYEKRRDMELELWDSDFNGEYNDDY